MSEKRDNKITIILPVFEEPEIVAKFITHNKKLLKKYPVIVINKKGGDILKEYASFYRKTNCPMIGWPLDRSRKFLIQRVQTQFTLILDVDVLLPTNFVKEALKKFNKPKVAVVALNYEKPQGHLAFGPSIWRTKILQKLYDWKFWKQPCECMYMWNKVNRENHKIETLNMKAKHLKLLGDSIKQKKAGVYNRAWNTSLQLGAKTVSKVMSPIDWRNNK